MLWVFFYKEKEGIGVVGNVGGLGVFLRGRHGSFGGGFFFWRVFFF